MYCVECRYQNSLRKSGVVDKSKDSIAVDNSVFCVVCQPKLVKNNYDTMTGYYLPYNDQMFGNDQYALVAKRIYENLELSKKHASTIDGVSLFHDAKSGKLVKRIVLTNFFVGYGAEVFDLKGEDKQ